MNLLAFNLGVEVGQLLALSAIVLLVFSGANAPNFPPSRSCKLAHNDGRFSADGYSAERVLGSLGQLENYR